VTPYERALELAERGYGKTGDHPLVGAVVVRDGEVVGEGWYEYEGVRHAEAIALEQAGDAARGATLYVTLEPCSHHGRTTPCADAVVAAGVARVVVGARDPNPLVDGRGLQRLAAAGIEVELLDDFAARRQNEAWRVWKSLGRPFVIYKAALTLDGRVTVPGRRWRSCCPGFGSGVKTWGRGWSGSAPDGANWMRARRSCWKTWGSSPPSGSASRGVSGAPTRRRSLSTWPPPPSTGSERGI